MMKRVLITGASRGIGYETAMKFADSGYTVYALWHNAPERLSDCNRENVIPVRGDVSDEASVFEILKAVGDVDILINNAAVAHFGLITDMSLEEWNRIISVDLNSVFLMSRAFLPAMISRKSGKIINVSSVFGVAGGSCEVAYSAAKAGIIGFTKALSKEVGPSGIQVNCIAPGVIETEMNARLSEEDKNALAQETALCRIGSAADVAKLALYLAEDQYITGEVINIGGGFMQ